MIKAAALCWCYGAGITRERKLLGKQKEGKKELAAVRQGRPPAGSLIAAQRANNRGAV